MGEDPQTVNRRDVFIFYGHADADWVRTLAENLHQSGLNVFFDEWDIASGDVLVHRPSGTNAARRQGEGSPPGVYDARNHELYSLCFALWHSVGRYVQGSAILPVITAK
jgi:hypothetical protein